MSIWWAIPAFVGLVGFLTLMGGLGGLLRLRLFSGSLRVMFGGGALAAAAIVGLIGLNLQTYSRLTYEQPVAEVTVRRAVDGQFTASVRKADSEGRYGAARDFVLAGDKFRLEGRVWKFQPWANVIGADAFYKLERIQGRWNDAAKENSTPSTADDSIGDEAGLDVFSLPLGEWSPIQPLDTVFGDGVYMPLTDGAVYEISLTQSGFVARGTNDIAERALRDWS